MKHILRTKNHAIILITQEEMDSLEEMLFAHDFGDYNEPWHETAHNTCRDLGDLRKSIENRHCSSAFDIAGAVLVGALLTIILVII